MATVVGGLPLDAAAAAAAAAAAVRAAEKAEINVTLQSHYRSFFCTI